MSERLENIGQRETLRHQKKRLVAEAMSHRDSIRAALSVTAEPHEIDGEYVMALAVSLNESLTELRGVDRKISILDRELGD